MKEGSELTEITEKTKLVAEDAQTKKLTLPTGNYRMIEKAGKLTLNQPLQESENAAK